MTTTTKSAVRIVSHDRPDRQLTATQMYWHDQTAIESMAEYLQCRGCPQDATPANWAEPFIRHGRRIPSEIKGMLITYAVRAGWTWNWRNA
jgi:hypothetical protein